MSNISIKGLRPKKLLYNIKFVHFQEGKEWNTYDSTV